MFSVYYFGRNKKRTHYFEAKFQYLLDLKKKLNKKTIFVNVEERIAFVNYLPNTFFLSKTLKMLFLQSYSWMINIALR